MHCECCAKLQGTSHNCQFPGRESHTIIPSHTMPQKGCVLSLTTWTLVQLLERKH